MSKTPEKVGNGLKAEPVGYAVYDVSAQRFITGVHASEADAEAAAVAPESHTLETRRV